MMKEEEEEDFCHHNDSQMIVVEIDRQCRDIKKSPLLHEV